MIKNIISKKYGWYLAKITASIENFKNVVATDLKTIQLYFLSPGKYIKIKCLNRIYSQNQLIHKFIILPYFHDFIENYWLLQNIIKLLNQDEFRYIDTEYLNGLTSLLKDFSESEHYRKGLKLKELLEIDVEYDKEMKIAMPESWLNENSIDLGETVLLRNDAPSPVII